MSENGMHILQKINFVPDLKQVDLDFYEHYVYGKQKRDKFLRVEKEKVRACAYRCMRTNSCIISW
jgi:hypothetical protein